MVKWKEIPKFKEKNPDCNTKLEQWLWLIDGSKEEKVEMSAKENEEINKTVKELNILDKYRENRYNNI